VDIVVSARLRSNLRSDSSILKSFGILLIAATPALSQSGFDTRVRPVITKSCTPCHNDSTASGGVNLEPFTSAASVSSQRAGWEKIVQKIQSGEMPPKGVPRPPQEKIDALVHYLHGEFQKADLNTKPDPGRVTARRLNRAEYSNTIRDLVGVDFRANQDFPSDDSGDGFDNMADVLSMSPLLMEKYVNAAERIAARAVGTEPLPKPVKFTFEQSAKNIRRIDVHAVEAEHSVDFDGDYDVIIGLPGERGANAKPVKLGFWMDGKLIHEQMVDTKPSKLVYFSPFSDAQMRLFLPQGEHAFRAGFIDDDFTESLAEKDYYATKKNKYPASITLMGPFATKVESESRKKIFICDPKSGTACVQKIVATLARRAYRRPVTPAEVSALMKFVEMARQNGEDTDHGIQLALQAILVSPRFLFRMERDANPTDVASVHRISDIELASRLSYFLWSSMPDDPLLSLAEAGKLHEPGALDAEVKRMLADSRSSALAENFAGQWLEIRNLDSVKPDPDRYMIWGPELRNSMKTETRMFFEYILKQNRPLSDFIDAKYTFLNERLAKFYGISGVTGPEFRKVELTTDQRGGILTQASVLTVSSYPTRTSPTIRGKYILNNILGTPPPAPPPDVPALDASKVGSEVSLRKQLEEHRNNPVCASCHSKMDVLGLAWITITRSENGEPWTASSPSKPVVPCQAEKPLLRPPRCAPSC
jgi:Protein of unknown function (DUF1592)/Protein of unknown function (DUF1587)/Protein of unknown function (DUF1588)/Protein of unknown function (DUF1595)/Cytochrome C oxidase, cbb3-type, subunit III